MKFKDYNELQIHIQQGAYHRLTNHGLITGMLYGIVYQLGDNNYWGYGIYNEINASFFIIDVEHGYIRSENRENDNFTYIHRSQVLFFRDISDFERMEIVLRMMACDMATIVNKYASSYFGGMSIEWSSLVSSYFSSLRDKNMFEVTLINDHKINLEDGLENLFMKSVMNGVNVYA